MRRKQVQRCSTCLGSPWLQPIQISEVCQHDGSFVNLASEQLVDMLCSFYHRLSRFDFHTVTSLDCSQEALQEHHLTIMGILGKLWRKFLERITKKNPMGQVFSIATGMSPTLLWMLAKLSATCLASLRRLAKNSGLFWTATELHRQMQSGQPVAAVVDNFVHPLIVKQVGQMPRHQWALWPKQMIFYTAK